MKHKYERVLCFLLSMVLCLSVMAPAVNAVAPLTNGSALLADEGNHPDDNQNPDDGGQPVEQFTLTFESNGGSAVEAVTAAKGTVIDLKEKTTTKEGYTFAGWYQEETLTTEVESVTLNANTTVYAKWTENAKPEQFTLTFETNGGSAVEAVTAAKGTVIDLKEKTTTKEGYTFAGWYQEEALTTKVESVTLNANTTVYAKWEEAEEPVKSYKLTFDTKGGNEIEPIMVNEGVAVSLSAYKPTREGFVFKGWCADEKAETLIADQTIILTADTTVYAQWDTEKVTLTFDTKGGEPMEAVEVEKNVEIDLTQAAYIPTYAGHEFLGWCADEKAETLIEGQKITLTEGKTIYAKWAEKTVLVSFELNGGRIYNNAGSVNVPEGGSRDLNDPKFMPRKDGYGFQGWYANAEFSGERLTEVEVEDKPVTIYAKWIEMERLNHKTLVSEIAKSVGGVYTGDDYSGSGIEEFIKISHPYYPASKKTQDPAGISMEDSKTNETYQLHQYEVYADGVVDYLGRVDGKTEKPGDKEPDKDAYIGVSFETVVKNNLDKELKAIGQGDRGMSYSWSGQGYGDWMYVTLQFNPAGQTNQMLKVDTDKEKNFKTYGGDSFMYEDDYGVPGCALIKVNVKTGEVKILMSRALNGLDAQFRNSVEFNGKLYFCGGVNHLPCIYEIDPETDAFQCAYQDESVLTYPGGAIEALKAARSKKICPTIRGLTKFETEDQKFLVISCVGMDGNPYIAVSDDPSSGHFTKIAYNYKPGTALEDQNKPENKGELLGYAAYKTPDSIFGGSIWEMAQVGNKLYAALCTGTPDNAEYKDGNKENGEMVSMQSFALIEGTLAEGGKVDDPAAWTWKPIAGDKEADGAPYTWGFDPERTRAGACNLLPFTTPDGQEYLYIGEYNDNQLAFKNMSDQKFEFLNRNVDQSISMYRLNPETGKVELVMGTPTSLFTPIAGSDSDEYVQRDVSGFGRQENQYFWQSKVFNGKMYWGTIDITQILNPVGKRISEEMDKNGSKLSDEIDTVEAEAEAAVAASTFSAETSVYQDILAARDVYEESRNDYSISMFAAAAADPYVPLPEGIFEEAPLVEVNSVDSLYTALLAVRDLMKGSDEWTSRETLQAQARMIVQMEEIETYVETTDDEIPASVMTAYKTVKYSHESITDMESLLKYMKGAIEGFDLFVSEDGVNFKAVTRTGMGDPYNNGLRVFATNTKPGNDADSASNNPWMTIGSANSFYGTQIWRMQADNLKDEALTPEKQYVEVRFIDENGKRVEHETDNDTAKAQIISVDKSATTVAHSVIENLYPDGAMMKEDHADSFEIKSDAAGSYIEVPCVHAYTLQLAVNGGHRIPNVKVPAGTEIDLTEEKYIPVKDGFDFDGWFTDKELKEDTKVEKITMDGHKTVYAKWVDERAVLTFETNGGTPIDAQSFVPGDVADMTKYVTTRENHTFLGWYTDKECTEEHKVGDTLQMDDDMTVYAKWEKTIKHTLTFETNGGTPIEAKEVVKGAKVDLTKYTTTREGYDFQGWYTHASMTDDYKVTTVTVNEDMTVYAKWTETPKPTEPTEPSEPSEPTEPTEPEKLECFYDDFDDCTAGWYHEAVDYMVSRGLMAGVGNRKFAPSAGMTRAMMVTVLYSEAGKPAVKEASTFKDVPTNQWFSDPIAWAQDTGIVSGVAPDRFAPNANITREQIATILWRNAGSKPGNANLGKFADSGKISSYAVDALKWAVENGIMAGDDQGRLNPTKTATRAEVAVMMMRFLGGSYVCTNR